jgi:RHS repeat-associated protein
LLCATLLASTSAGATPEAPTAQPVLYPGSEGRTQAFYGSYLHTLPIELPAYHGIEPRLALSYGSSGANGPVGVGWQLAGFSTLVRVNRSFGAPTFLGNDVFLLDGQELVPCTAGMVSPSCASGGTHATRIESYQRIVFNGDRSEWTVWQRNGVRATYTVLASRHYGDGQYSIVAGRPAPSDVPFRWGVSSVADTHPQNQVSYGWRFVDGDSYPSTIDYARAHVDIYTEDRPDPVTFAVGAVLAKTTQRIRTIDVRVLDRRARAYDLVYGLSETTWRSRLAAVRQFGSDAAVSAGIASGPSALQWSFVYSQGGATQLQLGTWTPSAGYAMSAAATVCGNDFNGDGREDCAQVLDNTQYVVFWLSRGDGTFQAQVYTSTSGPVRRADLRLGDWNGDGRSDLLFAPRGSSGASIWLSTPSAASPVAGAVAAVAYQLVAFTPSAGYGLDASQLRVGDFNGDGKDDIAHLVDGSPYINLWVSRGDGTFRLVVERALGHVFHSAGAQVGDFNGDGLADLMVATDGGPLELWLTEPQSYASCFGPVAPGQPSCAAEPVDASGGLSLRFASWSPGPGYAIGASRLKLGDFNGDGRTDIVDPVTGTGVVSIWLSRGDGTFEASNFQPWPGYRLQADDVQVGDVNGDGRADLVHFVSGSGSMAIWLAQGRAGPGCVNPGVIGPPPPGAIFCGLFAFGVTTTSAGAGQTVLGYQMRLLDLDGDGRSDVVQIHDGGASLSVWRATGGPNDLLTGVRDALGSFASIAYVASSAWSRSGRTPTVQTVASLALDDGRGNVVRDDFSYAGALYDWLGRRFLGFHGVTRQTGEGSEETVFRQDYGSASLPLMVTWRAADRKLLSQTVHQYADNGAQVPHTALESDRWDYEIDGQVTGDENPLYPGAVCSSWPCPHARRLHNAWSYDPYGQITRQVDYGDADHGDAPRTTERSYAPGAPYTVDRLTTERLWAGATPGGTPLAETQRYYDGASAVGAAVTAGDLTRQRRWNSESGAYLESRVEHDAATGNTTATVDEASARTELGWDPLQQLYPATVRNALGQVTSTDYDPLCGTLARSVDVSGQATTYRQDPFCRPLETRQPGGGFELRSYEATGLPQTQAVVVQTPGADAATNHITRLFVDGRGRAWKTVSTGPTPGRDITTTTDYDARGRVARVTAPAYPGDPVLGTSYSYDALGRLTTTTNPDATTARRIYGSGYVTSVDEGGHLSADFLSARGRVVRHQEWTGSEWLAAQTPVDARDNPSGIVDPVGNHWSFTFDSLGRKVRAHDPDAGDWSWEYDGAGRVTAYTDARGLRTELAYDALGRMVRKTTARGTDAERSVRWDWDGGSGAGNRGRLTGAGDALGTAQLDYDAAGNLVRLERTIDGADYVIQRSYDGANRLTASTYPEGTVQLVYDGAGHVRQIPGVVDAANWDASGRLVEQRNSNGTHTVRAWDAQGRLATMKTTGPSGTIQDLRYRRNADGQISEVESAFAEEHWRYAYDAAHRVLSASVADGDPDKVYRYQYDTVGNLTASTQGGNLGYPAAGQPRPHAAISTDGESMGYDAAGNLVYGKGRIITWDGDNRPQAISMAGSNWSFGYDADGNRIERIQDGKVTHFLGEEYAVAGGVATRTLLLEGIPVARRVAGTLQWLHVDHLGAVQAATDAAGQVVERDASWPYRQPMAPAIGAQPIGGGGDDAGLQYMGARWYDPQLGRFLSPDPLPDPSHLDGLNAYAYASNDPINRVDPEGASDTEGNAFYFTFGNAPDGFTVRTEKGWATLDSPLGLATLGQQAGSIAAQMENWVLSGYGYGRGYYVEMAQRYAQATQPPPPGVSLSPPALGGFAPQPVAYFTGLNASPLYSFAPLAGIAAAQDFYDWGQGLAVQGALSAAIWSMQTAGAAVHSYFGWDGGRAPAPPARRPPPPPAPPPPPPRLGPPAALPAPPLREATGRPLSPPATATAPSGLRSIAQTPGIRYNDGPAASAHVSPILARIARLAVAATDRFLDEYLGYLQEQAQSTLGRPPQDVSQLSREQRAALASQLREALLAAGANFATDMASWLRSRTEAIGSAFLDGIRQEQLSKLEAALAVHDPTGIANARDILAALDLLLPAEQRLIGERYVAWLIERDQRQRLAAAIDASGKRADVDAFLRGALIELRSRLVVAYPTLSTELRHRLAPWLWQDDPHYGGLFDVEVDDQGRPAFYPTEKLLRQQFLQLAALLTLKQGNDDEARYNYSRFEVPGKPNLSLLLLPVSPEDALRAWAMFSDNSPSAIMPKSIQSGGLVHSNDELLFIPTGAISQFAREGGLTLFLRNAAGEVSLMLSLNTALAAATERIGNAVPLATLLLAIGGRPIVARVAELRAALNGPVANALAAAETASTEATLGATRAQLLALRDLPAAERADAVGALIGVSRDHPAFADVSIPRSGPATYYDGVMNEIFEFMLQHPSLAGGSSLGPARALVVHGGALLPPATLESEGLLPTGELLARGRLPFSGEVGTGIVPDVGAQYDVGVNNTALSTVVMNKDTAEAVDYALGARGGWTPEIGQATIAELDRLAPFAAPGSLFGRASAMRRDLELRRIAAWPSLSPLEQELYRDPIPAVYGTNSARDVYQFMRSDTGAEVGVTGVPLDQITTIWVPAQDLERARQLYRAILEAHPGLQLRNLEELQR